MLAMEYGTVGVQQHKYACSTVSSDTLSESCGSRNNRIRTVRLVRPSHGLLPPPGLNYRHGPSLGFSIRGGREHGTGIFVSYVEIGSEAYNQGLRVGDQIIRINGFTVDDAVHKEVLQLISNHTHVTLKVRGVGMIPVKDRRTDTLSWQIVTESSSPIRESPQLGDKLSDVRINIMVAPKSKLGCGICKGPEWKPGIFVQFTKEGGVAREAGLRPGDQILYANNIDFSDIPFNEAVNLMKSSRQLSLIVRKSAGSELFPGESSGYNSSASSVTGDQSPSWSDSKRLSIVKEENLDLGERLNHLDKYKNLVNAEKWDAWDDEPDEKPLFKPTIINLSEKGSIIRNNGSDEPVIEEYETYNRSIPSRSGGNGLSIPPMPTKINGICDELYAVTQKQTEPKTVVVEVHKQDQNENYNVQNGHLQLGKSASTSSFCSIASKSSYTGSFTSSMTNSSLSSAITQEIQRRAQKKVTDQQGPSIDEQLQKKKILMNVNNDHHYQHNKLMDEFKRAHQKMFKPNESGDNQDIPNENMDRINSNISNNELSHKLSERLLTLQNEDKNESKRLNLTQIKSTNCTPPLPPPPPEKNANFNSSTISTPASSIASSRTNTLKQLKTNTRAPPVPTKCSVLSYNQNRVHTNQPPPCPTPDYDTLSLASTVSSGAAVFRRPVSQKILKDNNKEMQPTDSYKSSNSLDIMPKHPSTNCAKTSTIRKSRPISVTIGEYPSMRKQPGKLDFIQNGGKDSLDVRQDESLGSRLTSELTQTLNRSNLRKRTESMANPD
ncbi:uncharacterized protein LOC115882066 isoform X2 [Sitophilus oryzae]|uniref:Uncharacterized protein LOC115882066 isoform X2 n=1 Tax=Sitophilus oryzae TaxID=7048 RepID=A0A6J2XYD1_SITOR|nr:uncharacterized protein LOC115882066 isoform X2 [Sitophilus oryzae]